MYPAHRIYALFAAAGVAASMLALHAATSSVASDPPPDAVVSMSPAVLQATPGQPISIAVVAEGVPSKPVYQEDDPGGLGAFEFTLPYDPIALGFQSVTVGPFLGSTGRQITCLPPILAPNSVRFGCVSEGAAIAPSGGGLLATVQFAVFCPMAIDLNFWNVNLAEPLGKAIPVSSQGAQASCSESPATNTPTATSTPTATRTATRTPTHTRTPPSKALGDVNDDGSVDSEDALLVLQLEVGFIHSLINPGSADLNNDDTISSVDANLILQCTVGFIDICH